MNDSTSTSGSGSESVAAPPRFVVGIDLGTTNCALCWIDSCSAPQSVEVFRIPQLCAPGQTERQETLPSFCWFGTDEEASSGLLRLPWQTRNPAEAVGVYAQEQGRLSAGRLIESAKSWLCHAGVDRRAARCCRGMALRTYPACLPWQQLPCICDIFANRGMLNTLRTRWSSRM
ncbi:MAG UNVERIFIED_CONTAM: hypothetical protein LVR18_02740 [Planctomycetaceae bacterium]|jgi:hypothetical protein